MLFHDFVLARAFTHPRSSRGQLRHLCVASSRLVPVWANAFILGGDGRCLLLKMYVDKIFMKCQQQEISKHTSSHLHTCTLLAENLEQALKMT